MEDALLYSANHVMQRRDVLEVLNGLSTHSILKPRPNQRVLDLGCGPGDTTVFDLLPRLSPDSQVVGVDISAEMINHARNTFSNSRLQFYEYDLESCDVYKTSSLGQYDKIFSFYCLHWIQNQRAAYQNVYNLLKSEGEILFFFVIRSPIYILFETMARNPRWSKYMQDVKNFISPYHHSKNPSEEIKVLLKTIGFQNIQCTHHNRIFEFPSLGVLMKSIEAVDPFIRRIPDELKDAFLADCKSEVLNGHATASGNGDGYNVKYEAMTLYASKF